ncbi:kinesin-1 [Naegleria gruberi]|uniref:Kinesin-1 n=1 Tax=Naegleria gruberi TaxID=5762 RepID=D2VDS2_NAEGR|nr:kinesin-1 [Naegleria gruberi]EFC44949.1 kinesin-1 [Naegleria gruberi]|eukprot:XP_002677693.1 kinesin-1 [Naegleria gruberi]
MPPPPPSTSSSSTPRGKAMRSAFLPPETPLSTKIRKPIRATPSSSTSSSTNGTKLQEQEQLQDQCIKVYIRIRPNDDHDQLQIEFLNNSSIQVTCKNQEKADTPKVFLFDQVLDENVSQQQVFDLIGVPVVEELLQGFNASILGYGHTGSGKTFTMGTNLHEIADSFESGNLPAACGLLPRIVERLLNRKKVDEQLSCSLFEIYNGGVYDLFGEASKKCKVKYSNGVDVVTNAKKKLIHSLSDLSSISSGLKRRHQSATGQNLSSSRSHCIFRLFITTADNTERCLNMVDLAGSERQKTANIHADKMLLDEANYINTSLTVLKRCIEAVYNNQSNTDKKTLVPYREDNLALLLHSTLEGNSKTFFIGNIGTASESISTLNYAQTARKIKKMTSKLSSMLKKKSGGLFEEEIEKLKKELEETKGKLDEERDSKTKHIEELSQKIALLETKQQEANEILKQSNTIIEEMQIRDDSLKEICSEKEEIISNLFEELSKARKESELLEKDNSTLKSENSILLEAIENQCEIIRQRDKEHDSAFQNLKEQLDEYQKQSSSKTLTIQTLRDELKKKDKIIQRKSSTTAEQLYQTIENLLKTIEDQKKTIHMFLNGTMEVVDIDKEEAHDGNSCDSDDDDEKVMSDSPVVKSNKRKVISPLQNIVYESTDENNEPECKYSKSDLLEYLK